MICNVFYIKFRLELSSADYVGIWKRQEDNIEIRCSQLSDTKLECKWPNKKIAKYTIAGRTLTTGNFKGTYDGNGMITWSSNQHWVKQGIQNMQIVYLIWRYFHYKL